MQFDKTNLKEIRKDVNEALLEVAQKYGIQLKMGNIRFDANSFTGKLEALAPKADGTVETKFDKKQKMCAANLGLFAPKVVNKAIMIQGKKYVFVGYNSRAPKRPYQVKDVKTGKNFVLDADHVERAIENKQLIDA